jgi:hypothetical protein
MKKERVFWGKNYKDTKAFVIIVQSTMEVVEHCWSLKRHMGQPGYILDYLSWLSY